MKCVKKIEGGFKGYKGMWGQGTASRGRMENIFINRTTDFWERREVGGS